MSPNGTQRTNAADVTMSVVRGRPEVALPGRIPIAQYDLLDSKDELRNRKLVANWCLGSPSGKLRDVAGV